MAKKRTKLSDLTQLNARKMRKANSLVGASTAAIIAAGFAIYSAFINLYVFPKETDVLLEYIANSILFLGIAIVANSVAIIFCLRSLYQKE